MQFNDMFKYKTLIFAAIFILPVYAEKDSFHPVSAMPHHMREEVEDPLRIFPEGFPGARIDGFVEEDRHIVPEARDMHEEDDDGFDDLSLKMGIACLCCAKVTGACIGEYCLPSWDVSEDEPSPNAGIGSTACAAAMIFLLHNPVIVRGINEGCQTVSRLLHIKAD